MFCNGGKILKRMALGKNVVAPREVTEKAKEVTSADRISELKRDRKFNQTGDAFSLRNPAAACGCVSGPANGL